MKKKAVMQTRPWFARLSKYLFALLNSGANLRVKRENAEQAVFRNRSEDKKMKQNILQRVGITACIIGVMFTVCLMAGTARQTHLYQARQN